MYRIRFHGRGGQGMKTASRILGTAFFLEGYQVQDAPRYGAERRGAPMFAYVRAARTPINERGVIVSPDLVIVADDSLASIPAAGVLQGLTEHTVLLIATRESAETWRERLKVRGPLFVFGRAGAEDPAAGHVGAACAGAAARLIGVIPHTALERAVREELVSLPPAALEANVAQAAAAFEQFAGDAGAVAEGDVARATGYRPPEWVDLTFEEARVSAPAIHGALTSVEVRTGLWRTMRPVIDHDLCNQCVWVCSTFCPDSAISVDPEGWPVVDYDHCKGCMICVAKCPPHAISAVPEHEAQTKERLAKTTP
jgi:pyruvate ferredoxin oxidoreductase gamma subunit